MRDLPPFARPTAYTLKSLSHRNLYHSMVDLLRADGAVLVGATFRSALPLYDDLYVQGPPVDPRVSAAIAGGFATLGENVTARVVRGRRYADGLEGCDVTVPSRWADSGVLWRFSFLVNDSAKTVPVTTALRENGIRASNHYWSLADLLYDDKTHPTTARFCPRVVNLWVDETATPECIDLSCDIVARALR